MSTIIIVSIPLLLVVFIFYRFIQHKLKAIPENVIIPLSWKKILSEEVSFYNNLPEEDKYQFEQDCYHFLQDVSVTAYKGATLTLTDRLLVASSAVIPLFAFPQWTYDGLTEVLLYPSAFDRNFQLNNPNEIITGMVGNGALEGKVILSKPALIQGFKNNKDRQNVGIHEFVHLFDKLDGYIDGVPPHYEDKQYTMPWVDFIKVKVREILENESDINDYGATNHQEFFAVASEYFFEQPHLLKKKHPKLYEVLSQVFKQNPIDFLPKKESKSKVVPKRNAACICGSGLKYKKCCM